MVARSRTFHLPQHALAGLFIVLAASAFTAYSNSEPVGANGDSNIGIATDNNIREESSTSSGYAPYAEDIEESSSSKILDYLP